MQFLQLRCTTWIDLTELRTMKPKYINAILGTFFSGIGLLAAFQWGHSNSSFWMLVTLNFVSSIFFAFAVERLTKITRFSRIISLFTAISIFITLSIIGQAISQHRVTNLLDTRSTNVIGVIIEINKCYKSCKWAVTYSYQYKNEKFKDTFFSRNREFQIGESINLTIANTHPDVNRPLNID